LIPAEVEAMTGRDVSADDITLAASLIDDQTGYTPTEHVSERAISETAVKAAWSMVAVRVRTMLEGVGDEAVSAEVQGDYSYNESVTLAGKFRFSDVTDGRPSELLNISRARWVHL
jgi:hypothetical protein